MATFNTHWPQTVWNYMEEFFFFRSSVAKNQFTGKKTINDSLLPESLTLNPEAMNPDLESIIKQTKHSI